MKKYLLSVIIIFLSVFTFMNGQYVYAKCEFDKTATGVTAMIQGCMEETTVVAVKGDGTVEGAFKDKINGWTNNIALFLALLSVGSIIYGGLMMTLSAGEDEKIKKAKDIVKWSLIGFLGVVLATTIVTLVINVIYGLAPA